MIRKLFKKFFGAGTDYKALMERGAIIVDVRTPEEYSHGHIRGSLNIPLQGIQAHFAQLKKKGKPIVTVCRSGARSGVAASMLKREGLEVYNGGPYTVFQQKINTHVA